MKGIKVVLAIGLALVGCAGRSGALRWAVEDELREAKQLMATGRHRQAIDELSMLLELNTQQEEARFLRAVSYQELEEFALAIEDYQALLEKNPAHSRAHYNLGMLYAFKTGDPRKALFHWDRFLTLEPRHSKAPEIAELMRAIEPPQTGLTDSSFQDALNRIEDLSSAAEKRKHLQRLIQLYPDSPIPPYRLGRLWEEEGNRKEAVEAYRQALTVRPSSALAHRALGNLMIQTGRKWEGEIHLLKANLLDPIREEAP